MRIIVDGVGLECRVSGSGAGGWVTFVPGITNDLTFWDAQAEGLGDRFRVLCYDPRGHGASEPAAHGYSVARLGADVVGLWDALGIAQSDLVGLGFGGSLSIALALAQPQRVRRLVAVACRASMTPDFVELWRGRATDALGEGMVPLIEQTVGRWFSAPFAATHPGVLERMRAMVARTSTVGYAGHALAFTTVDLAARLSDLAVPTLFVSGGADPGGGRSEIMEAMAGAVPGARHVPIGGAGHLCNLEVPEKFNDVLREFLT